MYRLETHEELCAQLELVDKKEEQASMTLRQLPHVEASVKKGGAPYVFLASI